MFPSILALGREKILVSGTVERFGAYPGTGSCAGFSLLLVDSVIDYRILNGLVPTSEYPIGLTQPGDIVEFLANPDGSVKPREFRNLTLDSRLGLGTTAGKL